MTESQPTDTGAMPEARQGIENSPRPEDETDLDLQDNAARGLPSSAAVPERADSVIPEDSAEDATFPETAGEAECGHPRPVMTPEMRIFLDVVKNALAAGENVHLPALGTLALVNRAARMGRNPNTGEKISIPAHRQIRFKAGSALRARIEVGGQE